MGAQEISKVDFFQIFQTFWDKTMKVKIIQSSFCKTGLIPLNPSIILKKLKVYKKFKLQKIQILKGVEVIGLKFSQLHYPAHHYLFLPTGLPH
jgi:hypothetical protein